MIDLNNLKTLMGGNEVLVQKFLTIFKTEMPRQLANLQQAVHKKDWPQVDILSHTIKGQTAYLGLDEIVDLANQIRIAAETKSDVELIPAKASTLTNKLLEIITELEK